jgi:integrase
MIFLKFFRWLYNKDEPDQRKRITPLCMQGIKRLTRKEKSPYKPSDLWTEEEHELFLKYCPSKRDKAFHAMANDTSARPHELLNLKIKDIVFKRAENGIQYAEVLVCGKTKSRTLPLFTSIPYVKEWLHEHPLGNNPDAWLFISYSKLNKLGQLTRDGLLKKYGEYYRDRYYRGLILNPLVPDRDKAYIKNLVTKPWNLYIFRHSALTQKSQILKEHILRDHAGWSPRSTMPEVYLHYFGTESSTSLLEAHGIVQKDKAKKNLLTPISCPNCSESNKPNERFCISCKIVLNYDSYNELMLKSKEKESELRQFKEKYEKDMQSMREEIKDEIKQQVSKVVSLLKPEIVREALIS